MSELILKKKITRKEFFKLGIASGITTVGAILIPSILIKSNPVTAPVSEKLDPDTIKKIRSYSIGWWDNVNGVNIHDDLKKLGLID